MAKEIIKTNLKLSDKILLKYNDRDVDMSLSDFKTFLDTNLEPSSAVLTSSEPLQYKALISQNAPIASTNNDTMLAGQIWELSGAANPADQAFFDTYELVSGTLYAAGSRYRVSVDTPFTFSASAMEYDGSPYIVSTDINGDLNPFVNTLGGNPTFSYVATSSYNIILNGLFIKEKTFLDISKKSTDDDVIIYVKDINTLRINNSTSGTPADDILNYTPIEIEVYP